MAQGPCHTPEKVWYKRPCHTMVQAPCHTPQRPSQSQLLYPVPYLRNPVPYPYHTLATLTSAEHVLFPHANHTRAILRESRSRAGRTAQPLKQQQTLQSSRRLERQSSQEQDRTAQEQSRTAELFHTFQYVQVWHKPPYHTLEQGPCHTLPRVWHKPPCHTMEQLLARSQALGKGIKIHCQRCPISSESSMSSDDVFYF